jgi:hypothetical protein
MRKSSGAVYRVSIARTSQAHAAEIGPLLAKLRSEEGQAGWEEFLLQYSPALYQTARTLAHDEDDVADCFVHICEQLAKDRFGRLLRFKPDGAASFLTWLRVVARNSAMTGTEKSTVERGHSKYYKTCRLWSWRPTASGLSAIYPGKRRCSSCAEHGRASRLMN